MNLIAVYVCFFATENLSLPLLGLFVPKRVVKASKL